MSRSPGKALPENASDEAVLQFAHEHACGAVDLQPRRLLHLATKKPHHGMVVVIRRQTRAAERAALFRLLERAGETGIQDNINFTSSGRRIPTSRLPPAA